MSYKIRYRPAGYPDNSWRTVLGEFATAEEAQDQIDRYTDYWQDIHEFEIVPPYTPPAIVAEDDLTTAAGSPCMGGDDDLLGLPPGC